MMEMSKSFPPICLALAVCLGLAATTLGNVADIMVRLGRKVQWDWATQRFVNDDDANHMLSRPMRSPWTL